MADATERAAIVNAAGDRAAPDAPMAPPPGSAAFAAQATDLGALRDAVVDAASVGAGLWVSFLFVFLYLAIAAGGVTHRDLFFESPVKLPFLSVDLPLVGFFVLGPALFLIVHAYTLLHFVMLADKVGNFHTELQEQIPDEDARTRLRQQLPSNIFVQFLAGPRETRTGAMGFMLRLIAQISLVAGPLALMVFFQLQFLPYHNAAISWWQRFAVVADLLLLWVLWPSVARGSASSLQWRDFRSGRVVACLLVSVLAVLLVFAVATFPGEWLDKHLPALPFVAADWTPHKLLVEGEVDEVARRPNSLWSNRLVLPGLDAIDHAKLDDEAKIAAAATTVSLRGRHLEGAVLSGAVLRKADFTGAQLAGAALDQADLREAKFECANIGRPDPKCADLRGASLAAARLQGASLAGAQLQSALFPGAQLQGASLAGAQLQGVWFIGVQAQGASFFQAQLQDAFFFVHAIGHPIERAQLQGASFDEAALQGASLDQAQLQGASLDAAQLEGASLDSAQLEGASLQAVNLQGASLNGAELQGASLVNAVLQGASLDHAFVWRAETRDMQAEGARVIAPETAAKYWAQDCADKCDWSADTFAALKRLIGTQVPQGDLREKVLARISRLDPQQKVGWKSDLWTSLEHSSPQSEDYEKILAGIWREAGCGAGGAPYAIEGLLHSLDKRFKPNSSEAAALAAAFLDEANCPGAYGLPDEYKSTLRNIRDSAAPSPAAAPTPVKP